MLDFLRKTFEEVIESLRPDFPASALEYLRGLQVIRLQKSQLTLQSSHAELPPELREFIAGRVASALSSRLRVDVRVKILAPSAALQIQEGPQLQAARDPMEMEPLVDSGNKTACLLLEGLATGSILDLNLVFLYGPEGCGKSFLLQWFQRKVQAKASSWSAPLFHDTICRLRLNGGLLSFRRSLMGAKLFILDEVHRLRGKRRTQEELVLIIDELLARNAQILFLGRHHPKSIHGMARSLSSRLLGGFTVELKQPLPQTRRKFLLRLGLGRSLESPEVNALIQGPCGYGELLAINERLAARGIGNSTSGATRGMGDLLRRVADQFGVEEVLLEKRQASRRFSRARQALVFLALESGLSAAEIARHLGWRSSSSVNYAVKRVRERMNDDPDFRRRLEACQ